MVFLGILINILPLDTWKQYKSCY